MSASCSVSIPPARRETTAQSEKSGRILSPSGLMKWVSLRPGLLPVGNDRTIQAMLQNPVYIGKIRWNVNKSKKRIINNAVEVEYYKASPEDVVLVDGLHPAIVDEAVFQKAQELMGRSGPPPVPKKMS